MVDVVLCDYVMPFVVVVRRMNCQDMHMVVLVVVVESTQLLGIHVIHSDWQVEVMMVPYDCGIYVRLGLRHV
jgi:hypothetical protein